MEQRTDSMFEAQNSNAFIVTDTIKYTEIILKEELATNLEDGQNMTMTSELAPDTGILANRIAKISGVSENQQS